MMFIRDIKREEKVKCIQANLTTSKKLGLISKKGFTIENMSSENNKAKPNFKEKKDSKNKSKIDF